MAEQSTASKALWLLDGIEDFRHYSLALLQQSNRQIAILSHDLDEPLYGTSHSVQALLDFVRSSRHCHVHILVKDTKLAIATGHPLVRLAQRLSSKIHVRKMTQQPNNKEMAFMLGDTTKLLYKNDDSVYRGFFNSAAAREVKQLRDEFNYLWQYAEPEPEFQQLYL